MISRSRVELALDTDINCLSWRLERVVMFKPSASLLIAQGDRLS